MAASQLSLSLNQILASDAPVLSPVSPSMPDFQWDIPFYAHAPPSPPSSSASPQLPPTRMLKARTSPDPAPDACVPTHQLFDLNAPPSPVSSLLSADSPLPPHSEPAPPSNKRSASPSPAPAKKPRAQGERISSKDFVPPDVTGLTKREARLVKNRAAAFLSRQRKREEFEHMEHRVAELESENARLLALTQVPEDSNHLASEVEQLKAELAAARNRERELNAQLATRPGSSPPPEPPVKLEASDPFPLSSPARTSNVPFSNKSGASLGLMVLLCALPSLLSMPLQSTSASTSFTVPTPLLPMASSFDINSYLPNDYDWSRPSPSSIMDLDTDDHHRKFSTFSSARRLEFSSEIDAEQVGALGNLDISFDTTPSENGKIRVRIHPASSDSSRAPSPGASSSASSSTWDSDPFHIDRTYAAPSPSSASSTSAFSPISVSDPFFGLSGPGNDYGLSSMLDGSLGMLYGAGSPPGDTLSSLNFPHSPMAVTNLGLGNGEFSIPDPLSQGQKRRVRIALKSMPQAGGAEGGEWEVQLC